ncbi:hypothetical protein FNF29_03971 [Cafeteria roenbergensis]|uniref:Uncharacterized protein n=1 Tax=Cafeteria roenbergensis TaxID=33653 RepID=A0A5A8CH89_CAFRO|nr:hypothetical protein FNF29_03971 [Cafeteria roenbergensis]KAA0167848.1 hypothetical protein FNF31_00783 [Cafeteria roenbergensis]KAA0171609.1 hypothetical protein FNF28_00542 [Cafeteria roenbergensis]|eukprot:KAA0152405.1 hypothetical protein FNF29_03971 [Cafeteria roenbergensis]
MPSKVQGSEAAPPVPTYNQSTEWYDGQTLDHFNMQDARTYSQRFFVIDDFWKAPSGPVILHICGEYTCPGINPARLFPLEMAREHGALVVSVEHRFFGESQPFAGDAAGPLATPHLAYANSRQALADLAQFTAWFQETRINAAHGLPADNFNTWIVVGGSYPGALAAWYREKFPHLSAGSHSASGVVRAVLNYTQFDQQIASAAGPTCAGALRAITRALEDGLPGSKALLNASGLTNDGDFFYLVADSMAEPVQYAHRDELCNAVTPAFSAGKPVLPAYVQFVQEVFYARMGNSAEDYNSQNMADPVTGGNGRSWWWFKCSELAYWQVAPEEGSIRSSAVSYAYHRDLCFRVFGRTALPEVDATNVYYGSNKTAGTYTFFDNGSQDPWRWAGVQEQLPVENTVANVIECDGCAHCQSLYTPADSDPAELSADRDMLRAAYKVWAGRSNGP